MYNSYGRRLPHVRLVNTTGRDTRKPLADDTRGAIMVLGIAFGMVLIGVAWNICSVGAAALWRARAQDVADAAAFDAAVWHARGMNLLVMSNLMMAVFMAYYTFWRMIVTVVTGLSYLCNWPIFPPCALVQVLADAVEQVDSTVTRNVSVLLRSLSSTERAIATLAPIVPMAKTPATVLARYPEVRSAEDIIPWSMGLLPSKTPSTASTAGVSGQGLSGQSLPAQGLVSALGAGLTDADVQRALEQRLGWGVSLPVQSDDFNTLCSKSVEAQAWLTQRMLPFDIDRFGPWWKSMTGGDPGFFCLNDQFPPALRQAVRQGLIATCVMSSEPWKCVRRRLAQFSPMGPASDSGTTAVRTVKLWDQFENGSAFAGVSAAAELARPFLESNDNTLRIADPQGAAKLRTVSSVGRVEARAEYYCDCDQKWSDCRDDAAWRLCYRARLTDRAQAIPALPPAMLDALREVERRYGPLSRLASPARTE
jgi:hypothetical protein